MLIIKQISDQQMNEKNASNQLSQQQLRQRRREKILARASNNNSSQYDRYTSTQPKQNTEQKEKESAISALEMFNASKRHSKIKFTLQMIAIIMGIMVALIHQISSIGQLIFFICFFLIAMFSAYLEVTKANKVSKFTRETAFEDPLIEKISGIKQLDIVNKMLSIQASISPITKLMSAYFLLVVILSCVTDQ